MKRLIEFRMWNPYANKYLYDVENVYQCLSQQLVFDGIQPSRHTIGYDHVSEGMIWEQFTGRLLSKGDKVFEGTIAFYEEETDEGDIRTYLVCVWIEKWSMFAWLTSGEYIKYQDLGADSLDEESFWTYTLENSHEYHLAGNIHDESLMKKYF